MKILIWLLAVPFFVWSVAVGVTCFRGGTIPLTAIHVGGSFLAGVLWFALLEWPAFFVLVGIPLMLVGFVGGVVADWRARH